MSSRYSQSVLSEHVFVEIRKLEGIKKKQLHIMKQSNRQITMKITKIVQ